jgi:hypothetical protein
MAGRAPRRAVVFSHVRIGPVDQRFMEASLGHAGLQIVADHLRRNAAEEGEGAAMCPDPVMYGRLVWVKGVSSALVRDGDRSCVRPVDAV